VWDFKRQVEGWGAVLATQLGQNKWVRGWFDWLSARKIRSKGCGLIVKGLFDSMQHSSYCHVTLWQASGVVIRASWCKQCKQCKHCQANKGLYFLLQDRVDFCSTCIHLYLNSHLWLDWVFMRSFLVVRPVPYHFNAHDFNAWHWEIHLLEFKFCDDTRPADQLQAAIQQHAQLVSLLKAQGYHKVKLQTILCGAMGTIYTNLTQEPLQQLGLEYHQVKKLTLA